MPSAPLCCNSLEVPLSVGQLICELHRAAAPLCSIIAGVQWLSKVHQAFLLQPGALVPKEGVFPPKDRCGLCSCCNLSALGPGFVSPSGLVLPQPGWRQKHQERCLFWLVGWWFNIFFFLTETVDSEKSSSPKAPLPLQSMVGLFTWDKHIPCD